MTVGPSRRAPVALLGLALALWTAGSGKAAQLGPAWHDRKCALYRQAWSGALRRLGTAGLGHDFLDRHAAFLASNCTATAAVCPRSPQEFRIANDMVVLSMNFGTASTFPPFACPRLGYDPKPMPRRFAQETVTAAFGERGAVTWVGSNLA